MALILQALFHTDFAGGLQMYKGMYVAATGAVMRSNELDSVANNLANVSTSGYKRTTFSSRTYPILEGLAQQPQTIYPDARAMTFFGKASIDHSAGVMQTTGNAFDFAISGSGFFTVEKNGQLFYTRNGSFALDRDGTLVTPDGYRVLDRGNQPITIDTTEGKLSVSYDGNMYLINQDTNTNTLVGELKVSNLRNIQNAGGSLYTGTEEEATDFEVIQGSIERSNVNPVRELVGMIEASRQYELAQKVIQNFSDLAQRSVTDIASMKA
jgi:flagellar basal-body rod protein FlgG